MNSYEPRELLSSKDDYTGALEKVELIHKVLKGKAEFLFGQKVLALYGGWGSGKSSVVRTLMSERSSYKVSADYIPILFEAWEYEKDNNLSLSLFEMLLSREEGIKESLTKELKTIYSVLKGAAKGFSMTLPLSPAGGEISVNAEKIFDEMDKIDKEYSKWSYHSNRKNLKESFQNVIKKINKNGKKLLIFIDDLDRCENENVIKLITSIKHLFTLSDEIVFLVTIDKNAITQALKVKYGNESEKAEEYLEKIFPLNFSLDSKLNYKKYFDELEIENAKITHSGSNITDKSIRSSLEGTFLKYNVVTPRKFIRILNKVKLLESFEEIKNITCPDYRAFIYLASFNLFTMAEYERNHYNMFLENLKRSRVNMNFIEAFWVHQEKNVYNPAHDYLSDNRTRFSDEIYRDFREKILSLITNLI